jgi:hypothetical protein
MDVEKGDSPRVMKETYHSCFRVTLLTLEENRAVVLALFAFDFVRPGEL